MSLNFPRNRHLKSALLLLLLLFSQVHIFSRTSYFQADFFGPWGGGGAIAVVVAAAVVVVK